EKWFRAVQYEARVQQAVSDELLGKKASVEAQANGFEQEAGERALHLEGQARRHEGQAAVSQESAGRWTGVASQAAGAYVQTGAGAFLGGALLGSLFAGAEQGSAQAQEEAAARRRAEAERVREEAMRQASELRSHGMELEQRGSGLQS